MSSNVERVAAALRSAADFALDPTSPKVYGALASGSAARPLSPNDPAAFRWCATGYACKLLGIPSPAPINIVYGIASNIERAIAYFDDREHMHAAEELRLAANKVEVFA